MKNYWEDQMIWLTSKKSKKNKKKKKKGALRYFRGPILKPFYPKIKSEKSKRKWLKKLGDSLELAQL